MTLAIENFGKGIGFAPGIYVEANPNGDMKRNHPGRSMSYPKDK
jgi:hypothetical protein